MNHISSLLRDYYHEISWDQFEPHEFLCNLYCRHSEVEKEVFKNDIDQLEVLTHSELVVFIMANAMGLNNRPTEIEAQCWLTELKQWCNDKSN